MADTQSKDFRYVYANTFGVAFGANELQLTCGIQANPGSDDTTMERQTSVVMTLPSARLLNEILGVLLNDFEEATGKAIDWDRQKVQPLLDQLQQNRSAREQGITSK